MNVKKWILKPVAVLFSVAVCVPTAPADNLPLPQGEARTPETRTLTDEEAAGLAGAAEAVKAKVADLADIDV